MLVQEKLNIARRETSFHLCIEVISNSFLNEFLMKKKSRHTQQVHIKYKMVIKSVNMLNVSGPFLINSYIFDH